MEILKNPQTIVLKTSGINCDDETKYAFETAGSRTEIVQLSDLRSGKYDLKDFQIVVLPGGFSYGDDIAAGRIMALELNTFFKDEIMEHVYQRSGLVVAICNGFQVAVQSGLLPDGEMVSLSRIKASLEANTSGEFESRWVWLAPQESVCEAIKQKDPFALPVAHGEGRFVARKETIKEIEENGQVILRYCNLVT